MKEAIPGDTWFGRTVFESVGFVNASRGVEVPDIQFHSLPWSYPFRTRTPRSGTRSIPRLR